SFESMTFTLAARTRFVLPENGDWWGDSPLPSFSVGELCLPGSDGPGSESRETARPGRGVSEFVSSRKLGGGPGRPRTTGRLDVGWHGLAPHQTPSTHHVVQQC